MRLLAIDTAGALAAVALLDEQGSPARLKPAGAAPGGAWWVQAGSLGRRRGEAITRVIEEALAQAGWDPPVPDGLAVAAGPGSFTGLRVGLAVAKALAWAWERPLVGVDTLEAQAWAAAWAAPLVVSALDAGRGQVFAAVYRVAAGRPLPLETVAGPEAVGAGDWPGWLGPLVAGRAVAAVGDGCRAYRQRLERVDAAWVWAPEEAEVSRVVALARLGAAYLAAGHRDDPRTLDARYLRATEAERRWPPST